ncbi:class I adenylate-forming enzyme family protein [Aliiroseovarius marinus]|uniref:class I adenylate-forming enzyme family protein n=1 Tax=Aliiroseovarius marinus TaxID=2500159 RepID=UPI003D7D6BD2
MLSVIAPTAPLPRAPNPFNMAQYVLRHADDMGEKTALSLLAPDPAGDQHWSFLDLERAVRGLAGGLLARGLVPGDRVLLRLGNSVDFPLAFLGAIAAGLVPIPTSAQLTTSEITAMCDLVSPALIIADAAIAQPHAPTIPTINTDQLHQLSDHAPAPFHQGDPERPAYIVFTSGTTGRTRAVLHAHRAIWARQMMWDGWYGFGAEDRMMHAGAFNWTYTLGTGLMDPWSVGASAMIPAPGTSPDQLAQLIARSETSIFAAAPGVYRQILKHDLPPLPALRHGLSAGEKLPETTRRSWLQRTNTPLHEAYGMSECSTFISGSPASPAPENTLGFAQSGRHLAVLDQDGRPVPVGTPGQLAIHQDDPGLMLGYLGAETATNDRFLGPWFVTGDTVTLCKDAALRFEGRRDDMMNAGGFRVSPIEVEAALSTHPGVHEAACAEVQIKEDASIIACFYTPETDPVAEEDLSAHAHAHLAHYKCPRLYLPVESLPRGANNKLLRAQLKDAFEARKLNTITP